MPATPDDEGDVDAVDPNGLPYIDHRHVAVLWSEDDEKPVVQWDAVSIYEAVGMLEAGLAKLRQQARLV